MMVVLGPMVVEWELSPILRSTLKDMAPVRLKFDGREHPKKKV